MKDYSKEEIAEIIEMTEASVKDLSRNIEILAANEPYKIQGSLSPKEFGMQKRRVNKFPKYKKSNNFTKK